jgi:tRNA U38,U39,U40 pseudouridine synthase TruA
VHARGQVIALDADESHFDAHALGRALNRKLGPEIAVDRIEEVAPTFDARLSCTARSYRYHVLNRPVGDPLRRRRRRPASGSERIPPEGAVAIARPSESVSGVPNGERPAGLPGGAFVQRSVVTSV